MTFCRFLVLGFAEIPALSRHRPSTSTRRLAMIIVARTPQKEPAKPLFSDSTLVLAQRSADSYSLRV